VERGTPTAPVVVVEVAPRHPSATLAGGLSPWFDA